MAPQVPEQSFPTRFRQDFGLVQERRGRAVRSPAPSPTAVAPPLAGPRTRAHPPRLHGGWHLALAVRPLTDQGGAAPPPLAGPRTRGAEAGHRHRESGQERKAQRRGSGDRREESRNDWINFYLDSSKKIFVI